MKDNLINIICGIIIGISIIIPRVNVIPDKYSVDFLLIIICVLLVAIFLQLADLKKKRK